MRLFVLATAWILVAGAPAKTYGGFYSGNDLLRVCEKERNTTCVGYILGVADTQNASVRNERRRVCIPERAEPRQLVDLVLAYLKEKPQERHWEAWTIVHNALVASFPCPSIIKQSS
jgi:hypothetical protein